MIKAPHQWQMLSVSLLKHAQPHTHTRTHNTHAQPHTHTHIHTCTTSHTHTHTHTCTTSHTHIHTCTTSHTLHTTHMHNLTHTHYTQHTCTTSHTLHTSRISSCYKPGSDLYRFIRTSVWDHTHLSEQSYRLQTQEVWCFTVMVVAMATEVWQSLLCRYCCQCVPMYTHTHSTSSSHIYILTFHPPPALPKHSPHKWTPKLKKDQPPPYPLSLIPSPPPPPPHIHTLTESKTVF